jgi:hypothetical protein
MYKRLLETTTDEALRCDVAEGGVCPFSPVPKYDAECCELSLNGIMLLRLKRRQNQHAILYAFEDQGWLPWIAWPLATDAENQHRDVLYRLNHGQSPQLIEFSCDGSGCGVRWKSIG